LILAPWASRRRQDLLDLLDQLSPKTQELTRALEDEVEKRPVTRRLMTHPGVGPLTALAFELVIGSPERFHCGKQIASYVGLVPSEESSDTAKSRTAYQDFFALWKQADPDIPILKEAKAEYAKLH
jgi:transposase